MRGAGRIVMHGRRRKVPEQCRGLKAEIGGAGRREGQCVVHPVSKQRKRAQQPTSVVPIHFLLPCTSFPRDSAPTASNPLPQATSSQACREPGGENSKGQGGGGRGGKYL